MATILYYVANLGYESRSIIITKAQDEFLEWLVLIMYRKNVFINFPAQKRAYLMRVGLPLLHDTQ